MKKVVLKKHILEDKIESMIERQMYLNTNKYKNNKDENEEKIISGFLNNIECINKYESLPIIIKKRLSLIDKINRKIFKVKDNILLSNKIENGIVDLINKYKSLKNCKIEGDDVYTELNIYHIITRFGIYDIKTVNDVEIILK